MSTEGDYFTEVDILCGLANTNLTNISKDSLNKNFFISVNRITHQGYYLMPLKKWV
jgi:hypothetical protein